jgi:transposase
VSSVGKILAPGARAGEGVALVAAESLGESQHGEETASQPAVCAEPQMLKAYLLKESLNRLWEYRYEGAMLRCLQSWIDQLRWQRLKPFEKLAWMPLDHLQGILNYGGRGSRMGVVEAIP